MGQQQSIQFSLTQIFILTAIIGAVISVVKPPSLIPVVLLAVVYALATLLLWSGLMLCGRLIILVVGSLANASIGLLGEVAYRVGRVINFDPQSEQILADCPLPHGPLEAHRSSPMAMASGDCLNVRPFPWDETAHDRETSVGSRTRSSPTEGLAPHDRLLVDEH